MNKEYYGFISYARLDETCANNIHKFIEHYRYPVKLVAEKDRPQDAKYLRPIFIDRSDLSVVASSFWDELEETLKNTRYLIVICTENSAREKSVCHWEIQTFLKYHTEDAILPIVVGEVTGKNIPCELKEIVARRNVVVLDPDLPVKSFENREKLFHAIEFLLKVRPGVLQNRYERERKKFQAFILLSLISVLSVITVLSLFALFESHQATLQERARVKFEKKVFPSSLVYGYAKNFVVPLVRHSPGRKCILLIAMPENYSELVNSEKVKLANVERDLKPLGWMKDEVSIEVPNRRAIKISELSHASQTTNTSVYVDAASTVTAVKTVVDYLTSNNSYYAPTEKNKLAMDYVKEFKECLLEMVKKELAEEPNYLQKKEIYFVANAKELKDALDKLKYNRER